MTDFYLQLNEEELYDVQLAVLMILDRIKNNKNFKNNLTSANQKIKILLEGSERDLMPYC